MDEVGQTQMPGDQCNFNCFVILMEKNHLEGRNVLHHLGACPQVETRYVSHDPVEVLRSLYIVLVRGCSYIT